MTSFKRSKLITLTDAMRTKLAETMPLWAQAQARFEATFGPLKAAAFLRRSLALIASAEFKAAFFRSGGGAGEVDGSR